MLILICIIRHANEGGKYFVVFGEHQVCCPTLPPASAGRGVGIYSLSKSSSLKLIQFVFHTLVSCDEGDKGGGVTLCST